MPRSKSLARYPNLYFALMERAYELGELKLEFNRLADAHSERRRLYAFVNALKWEKHPRYREAAYIQLAVEPMDKSNPSQKDQPAYLILRHADLDPKLAPLRAALEKAEESIAPKPAEPHHQQDDGQDDGFSFDEALDHYLGR